MNHARSSLMHPNKHVVACTCLDNDNISTEITATRSIYKGLSNHTSINDDFYTNKASGFCSDGPGEDRFSVSRDGEYAVISVVPSTFISYYFVKS